MVSLASKVKQFIKRRHRLEAEDRFALQMLREHRCQTVLDVGCGVGRFLKQLPMSSYGIDWNADNLLQISPDTTRLQGDALRLPFADCSFDGVHCSHLIEHFASLDAYRHLLELGRVIRVGGILIIRTPVLWKGFYNDLTHVRPYNPEVFLRYMCQKGGQKTLKSPNFRFEFVELKWRYLPIVYVSRPTGWRWLLKAIADWVCRFHIHSLRRDAYTLVLRRVE